MSTELQQTAWATDLHPPRWYWLLPFALPLAALVFILYQSTQVLPRLLVVPAFSLTDQTGNRLTSEDLRGDLVIYAFAQPNCSTPCYDASPVLQRLQQSLGDSAIDGVPLRFVAVSEGQTLQNAQHLGLDTGTGGADAKLWHFVSAGPEQFNAMFAANGAKRTASPLYALVDGWGIVRAFYATA